VCQGALSNAKRLWIIKTRISHAHDEDKLQVMMVEMKRGPIAVKIMKRRKRRSPLGKEQRKFK